MIDLSSEQIAEILDKMLSEDDRAHLTDERSAINAILAEATATDHDRPMSADDLREIEVGAAVRVHRANRDGTIPEDLADLALWLACREWANAKPTGGLFWPRASVDAPTFSFNLLQQMAVLAPDPLRQVLPVVAVLCMDIALDGVAPDSDVPRSAFFAGLALGKLDEARAMSSVEAMRTRMKTIAEASASALARKAADAKRLEKGRNKLKAGADKRRALLLDFARGAIAENPHIPTIQIARDFRQKHRPSAGADTDLEDNEVRDWRRDGSLPPRVPRKMKPPS